MDVERRYPDGGRGQEQLRSALPLGDVQPDPGSEQRISQELERLQGYSDLADAVQNRDERKKYAERAFWLAVGWLVAVFAVVVASGFGSDVFQVPAEVLTTLAVSTTGTVFGVVYIIMRHLFPDRFQGPKS